MKSSIVFFFTLLTICSFGQSAKVILTGIDVDSLFKAQQIEAIGKPLPHFTANSMNKSFTNEDLKGKTVFINMWFAACPPCIAELTELNKLYDTLKSNERFEFISFTFERPEVIKNVIKKYNIQYRIFSLTANDCNRLNRNTAFPTSILIDSAGITKFMRVGGSKDQTEIHVTIFGDYYPKILAAL